MLLSWPIFLLVNTLLFVCITISRPALEYNTLGAPTGSVSKALHLSHAEIWSNGSRACMRTTTLRSILRLCTQLGHSSTVGWLSEDHQNWTADVFLQVSRLLRTDDTGELQSQALEMSEQSANTSTRGCLATSRQNLILHIEVHSAIDEQIVRCWHTFPNHITCGKCACATARLQSRI
ncbi:hypothetical protein BKA63DRAFT_509150 [Paraphoma chrysanthemicola]|nr:hypothetical protein BKA63DRAFT_509150 [Paraphoma chrysanthemicola]